MRRPASGGAQCAVIGIPDDKWGETVHAVVMRKPGIPVTGDDIVAHCKERIAALQVPAQRSRAGRAAANVRAGKILKRELRKPYWEPEQHQNA